MLAVLNAKETANFCSEPWGEISIPHITANRGWDLVRNKGQLTYEESVHIADCAVCNSWLFRFTEMAKRAGFEIKLWIPPLDSTVVRPTEIKPPDSESTD